MFTIQDEAEIPEGYVRYYRTITDDINTYNVWNDRGNPNINTKYTDTTVLVPDSIDIGKDFHINIGIKYTKINGEEKKKVFKANYTKIDRKDWAIFKGNTLHQVNAVGSGVVNTTDPSNVSAMVSTFGVNGYNIFGRTET